MAEHRKDLITGVILLTIAVFYRIAASGIQVFKGMGATLISARTIPYFWSYILMLLSSLLIGRSLKNISHKKGELANGQPSGILAGLTKYYSVIATFFLLVLYSFSIQPIGYLISTMVYLPVQILLLTPHGSRSKILPAALIVSVIFAILTYVLFVKLLAINLPKGLLRF